MKRYKYYIFYHHSNGFGSITITSYRSEIDNEGMKEFKDYIEGDRYCRNVAIVNVMPLPIVHPDSLKDKAL